MTAPALTYVQMPLDSGNTGKKIQTQSELVGADTVHAHYFVPRSRRKVTGRYFFGLPVQSVVASAHNGTSTGFAWFQNPASATVKARLKYLRVEHTCIGEVDMLSTPRIAIARCTFTGTASGATNGVAKSKTGDATNQADIRTAVTGMTVTVGQIAWQTGVPVLMLTTSGQVWASGPVAIFDPVDEEDFIEIEPGGCILLYQPDNGTATDTRRFTVCGAFDEFDNA